MDKKYFEMVSSNEELVDRILESTSGDQVREELNHNGIILKEEDLGEFSGILADAFEKKQNKKYLLENDKWWINTYWKINPMGKNFVYL